MGIPGLKGLTQFLERLSAGRRIALAAVSFAALVAVDVVSGASISLMPFYLVVVLFAVWSAGMIWGGVFLVATLAAAVIAGELYGHSFTSRGYFYIDIAGRFLVYLIVLAIAGSARDAYAREQALARSDSLTALAKRAGKNGVEQLELDPLPVNAANPAGGTKEVTA